MKLTLLTVALLIPVGAHAAATAQRVDDPHPPDQPPATSSVYVTVSPAPGDIGLPGGIFIGAYDPVRNERDYLAEGEWHRYQGGVIEPTEQFAALPASVNFTLARHQSLCALTGNRSLDLYAGYGDLNSQAQETVSVFAQHVTPGITAAHIALTLEEHDMEAQPGKYWRVLSITCDTSN